jgi:hypothetical protein
VSPPYEARPRAQREYLRLAVEHRGAFRAARGRLVAGLRESPPRFDPAPRVKRVQGHERVWELTWAPDGRATFAHGAEVRPGEAHIIWRRIGDHSILADP